MADDNTDTLVGKRKIAPFNSVITLSRENVFIYIECVSLVAGELLCMLLLLCVDPLCSSLSVYTTVRRSPIFHIPCCFNIQSSLIFSSSLSVSFASQLPQKKITRRGCLICSLPHLLSRE